MTEKEIYLEGAKDVLAYIIEHMSKRQQTAELGRTLAQERVNQLEQSVKEENKNM